MPISCDKSDASAGEVIIAAVEPIDSLTVARCSAICRREAGRGRSASGVSKLDAQHVHISLSRSERAHAHRNVSHEAFDLPSAVNNGRVCQAFNPPQVESREKRSLLC